MKETPSSDAPVEDTVVGGRSGGPYSDEFPKQLKSTGLEAMINI